MQVRFEYEFHDEAGKWFIAHGNEGCGCSMQQSVLNIAADFVLSNTQQLTGFSVWSCPSTSEACPHPDLPL